MNIQKNTAKGTDKAKYQVFNDQPVHSLMQNPYANAPVYGANYNYPQQSDVTYGYPLNNQQYGYNGAQPQNVYQGGYGGYGAPSNNGYGGAAQYHAHNVYESKPYREDYFKKKIENQIIKRTEASGSVEMGTTEFDDYFEKHVEKFFTPEIQEIILYHYQGYVFGLQFLYRDSWGKTNKETYKGEVHMADNVDKKNCECAKMTLNFDEYVKEVYVQTNEYVNFLKFVTNQGNVLEIGKPTVQDVKNIVPDNSKVLGIGGTLNICLNSVYFYYT